MTTLTGEVQQWRDGRWRTVLTVAGTPVVDNRRHPYHNPEPGREQLLFGFDGSRDGPATLFKVRDGRVYNVRGDHTHWGRPR